MNVTNKYIREYLTVARKSFTICKTSEKKIQSFFKKLNEFINDEFKIKFNELVLYDIKNLKDCSEKSIVEFYIKSATEMLNNGETFTSEESYNSLKKQTRSKLSMKYTQNQHFDNNIDIYFNEVKNEYIKHPQFESNDLEFIPENRDIFIKNNLKLVIECAKRYRNLGLPFEDLIQAGNYGLLVAFDKFDKNRANLRNQIIKDIKNHQSDFFSKEEAEEIIKNNFAYAKNLDSTISIIPDSGFESKEDFIKWSKDNIKTAIFASVAFQWIRAHIIIELNKYSKIINIPKTTQNNLGSTSIIRLDSLNPYTNDCYHDNQLSDYINEEYMCEDETYEEQEQQERFKDIVSELLECLSVTDRRIIMKKFGIGYPYPMSVLDIADSENIPQNKVKYSITQTMKILNEKGKNKNLYNELFS